MENMTIEEQKEVYAFLLKRYHRQEEILNNNLDKIKEAEESIKNIRQEMAVTYKGLQKYKLGEYDEY